MKTSTSFKNIIIASCLLSHVAPTNAMAPAGASVLTAPLTSTAVAVFAASLFRFFSRKPDNQPNRYDIERIKNLDLSYIWENKLNIIDDGWIGNPGNYDFKSKDHDSGLSLVLRQEKIEARGFYGLCSELAKPLGKTLGCMGVLTATYVTWNTGLENWKKLLNGSIGIQKLIKAAETAADKGK